MTTELDDLYYKNKYLKYKRKYNFLKTDASQIYNSPNNIIKIKQLTGGQIFIKILPEMNTDFIKIISEE